MAPGPILFLLLTLARPAAADCTPEQARPAYIKADDKIGFIGQLVGECRDRIEKVSADYRSAKRDPNVTTEQLEEKRAALTAAVSDLQTIHDTIEKQAVTAGELLGMGKMFQKEANRQMKPVLDRIEAIRGENPEVFKASDGKFAGAEPALPEDDGQKKKQDKAAAREEAKRRHDQAVQTQDPKDLARSGEGYLKSDEPQKAVEDYGQAVKKDPKNVDARQGLVQAKLSSGDEKGALQDAKVLLALDPKNQLAQLVVGHGDSIAQGGSRMKLKADFGSRESDSTAGVAGRPQSGLPGGPAPGSSIASQTPVANPSAGPGTSLLQQARESLRMRDFSGGLIAARRAADRDPKNPEAWTLLAELSNQAGNPKGALEAAKTALALDPDNAQALREKAYAEYQLGDYRAAYDDALRATRLDPKSGLGFLYLAMAEEKLGMTADALQHFEQAVELDATLGPLAADALARLRGDSPSKNIGDAVKRRLVRGGALTFSLALIVLGLLGAAAGKALTTRGRGASPEATLLESVAEPAAGATIAGAYRVSGELGRGGMGVVYDATDEKLQRRVALKKLQRTRDTTSEDLARLLAEARLVASLKHPSVAEIYNVVDEGDLYLVFEFIDGQSLDKLLALNKRLPPSRVRTILAQVASALGHAHERRIIHRDLKPSNIMIAKDGSAKVMDFGIAHRASGAAAATMTVASGTPPYMAPEQTLGSVSPASDLFALGVMAYEMLTGSLPFPGPDFLGQKQRGEFTPATQRDAGLPPALDAFFAAALAPDPSRRPADAKAFSRLFEASCPTA